MMVMAMMMMRIMGGRLATVPRGSAKPRGGPAEPPKGFGGGPSEPPASQQASKTPESSCGLRVRGRGLSQSLPPATQSPIKDAHSIQPRPGMQAVAGPGDGEIGRGGEPGAEWRIASACRGAKAEAHMHGKSGNARAKGCEGGTTAPTPGLPCCSYNRRRCPPSPCTSSTRPSAP